MPDYDLPSMAAGGQWLSRTADRPPQYIVHEAHIKRLFADGWQPAADPRTPQAPVAPPVDAEKEEMKQRIAKLEAMLHQGLDSKDAPVSTASTGASFEPEQPTGAEQKPAPRKR